MNSSPEEKLPERPDKHVIGDQALRAFQYRIKPEWTYEESRRDYGWDLLLTIVRDSNVTDDCFIQLKGHLEPSYIENKQYIAETLEVTTSNFLLRKSMPSMLCVCDVGNEEKLFYAWINDDIERIKRENPNWQKQGTVVIRVPVNNIIERDPEIHKRIEEYINKFHNALRNNNEIVKVLSPSLGIDRESLSTLQKEAVLQIARPMLEKAGLIDDTAENIDAYKPEDQELLRKIKEISVLLNNFQDLKAKQMIDELSPQIEEAPNSLRAKYFNNCGVYYIHTGDLDSAVHNFKIALSFSPENHKIKTNYLLVEFNNLRRTGQISEEQMKKMMASLESIIKEIPDFHPAVRTKTYYLGKMASSKEAESYIINTRTWEVEPIESRISLAEVYIREGDLKRAKELLKGFEEKNGFVIYSMLGYIYLSLATGMTRDGAESYMTGMGPSSTNYEFLEKAEANYRKAYEKLSRLGLPPLSEEVIVNYSVVLHLRYKHEESLRVCKSFLELNPESHLIQASIAQTYLGLGRPERAVPFSKKAFEFNPNSTSLKNYCICLFEAEDYDTLILIINANLDKNIGSKEKGLLLSLLALSYNEVGNIAGSKEAVDKLHADEKFAGDAVSVEATISRRNGGSREEALRIYREGKERHSDNNILLTNLAGALNPADRTEADELVKCFDQILAKRELLPEEYIAFSRAHITLSEPDKSLRLIIRAHDHYPEDLKILYALAISLATSGDQERAYSVLKDYLYGSSSDYSQIRNMAFLAYHTGRIEEAISLLQKALGKTIDTRERGELHCHLFELKRIVGRPSSELIHHVHEFGKTTGTDDQLEARYLSMSMLVSLNDVVDTDESKEWFDTARERLRIFSEKNPRNPFFKSVKFDLNVPEEKKGSEILSTIMAELLPHSLRTAELNIAVRSGQFPLTFRATYLGGHSIFEYWASCTKSKEKENQLHIWNSTTNLGTEFEMARKSKRVCIDISALLTLAGLDLLDVLQEFILIVFARGTKYLLDKEFAGMTLPHELAKKIEIWRLKNKDRIRIRGIGEDVDEDIDARDLYQASASGVLIRRDTSLQKTLSGGMGESILIARQMNIPLYSDDAIIRLLGTQQYGIETFSTISLVDALVEKGNITTEGSAEIVVRLIQSNYVIVPFDLRHLNAALFRFLRSNPGTHVTRDDLISDDILGTLLRQFGDLSLDYSTLAKVAVEWWISLFAETRISRELIMECILPVSYALSMHFLSGVIKGTVKEEQEIRLAGIWLALIMRTIRGDFFSDVWATIKSVSERIYSTEQQKYLKIIYTDIPKSFVNFLEKMNAKKEEKIDLALRFTEHLPPDDKNKIENYISKARPRFMS